MSYRYPKPHHSPRFVPAKGVSDSQHTLAVPGFRQSRSYSCGYACALMIARYYEVEIAGEELYQRLGTTREGTSQSALIKALRSCGVRANTRYDFDFSVLKSSISLGKLVVAYLGDAEHWIVLYGYGEDPGAVFVADPRPLEPCVYRWDDYEARLGGFGIVCSTRNESDLVATEPSLSEHPASAGFQLALPFDSRG